MRTLKTGVIFVALLMILNINTFSQNTNTSDKNLIEMQDTEKNTNTDIYDFIETMQEPALKEKISKSHNSINGFFDHFAKKVTELTNDITDPTQLFNEKIKLAEAFEKLLDKKFTDVDAKLKKVTTLEQYRIYWFERVVYIFLKAKLQAFKYTESLANSKTENLNQYKKMFDTYLADILTFIYKNQELYKYNSMFIKKIFLIEDTHSGESSQDTLVNGDLDLLFEFMKGKFKDYQGIFVKTASFKKAETGTARDTGMVIFMSYQPIPAAVKIKDVRTIEVAVTGDNLEDIVTYTLNQASNIANMKVASDKTMLKIRTENVDYKKMVEESVSLSKTAILKVELMFKKEIKPEKKKGEEKKEEEDKNDPNRKKTLEVGLRLKVGLKE